MADVIEARISFSSENSRLSGGVDVLTTIYSVPQSVTVTVKTRVGMGGAAITATARNRPNIKLGIFK